MKIYFIHLGQWKDDNCNKKANSFICKKPNGTVSGIGPFGRGPPGIHTTVPNNIDGVCPQDFIPSPISKYFICPLWLAH